VVSLPTRTLSVCLDFPAELATAVWGLHTSMTAEAMPFPTAITRTHTHDATRGATGDRHIFSWSRENPSLSCALPARMGLPRHAPTDRSAGEAQRGDERARDRAGR
jgi:hypothetical protein